MNFVVIQIIGGVAFATLATSYYKKEKKSILFLHIVAYVMFTIHYYLLNGVTGAICNAIGLLALISIFLSEKYKWNDKNIIAFIFIIMLLIVNITTFQNMFSIFPMIASTVVILSFMMNNEDYIRGFGVISAVCWLIYAIVYKSYISIFFEIVTLIGTIIAFAKNTKNTKFKIEEYK